MSDPGVVRIEPWAEGGFLLLGLLGDPRMTSTSAARTTTRSSPSVRPATRGWQNSGTGRMFRIVNAATDEAVGSVGYGTRRGGTNRSMRSDGCSPRVSRGGAWPALQPPMQSRMPDRTESIGSCMRCPATENRPSNLICRRLGFSLIEECQVEYPRSIFMQVQRLVSRPLRDHSNERRGNRTCGLDGVIGELLVRAGCESGRQDSNLRPLVPQTSPHLPMSAEFDLEWFRREIVGMTTRARLMESVGIAWTSREVRP